MSLFDRNVNSFSFAPEMPVKAEPFDHQKKAFEYACDQFGLAGGLPKSTGVALFMEMGTGKSLTAIGIAGALFLLRRISRVLIVSPLSVMGVWEQEFESFADFPYELTILKGASAHKEKQLSNIPTGGDLLEVVVVNYDSVWRIEDAVKFFSPDLVIADEGHKIKNGKAKQSKAMHHIGDKACYRLLLTGTAITNKEIDIFSEYRFLEPDVFGKNFLQFRNRYFYMGGYENHVPFFKKKMTSEFKKKIHSVAYRVTKEECFSGKGGNGLRLPEIQEEIRPVELEPKARKAYDQLQKDFFIELQNDDGVTANNVLTRMMRLSQLTGGHLTSDEGVVETFSTAKLKSLDDILDSAMADDQKIVIMARFVAELDDIEALLKKKKLEYAAVRGGIKDRDKEINRFQNDPDCKVFVGQIAAAGLGITLTAAHVMVFYSLDYNMANFDQAKARIHRAGQKQDCLYVYLVAKNTVDMKVLDSLRRKIDLSNSLMDDVRAGKNPYKTD